jgi:hypothetical protein
VAFTAGEDKAGTEIMVYWNDGEKVVRLFYQNGSTGGME